MILGIIRVVLPVWMAQLGWDGLGQTATFICLIVGRLVDQK